MAEERQEMDVDAIVEKAFDYFDRFVNRGNRLDGVLLEGLEPEEDGWIVSIGFDGKRQETSEPATAGAMAALSGFGSKTVKTVREVRHIHLGNEGSFKKMD
ncbi:hypothetical protein [Salipiger thiooxidans]|uniref:hypothetical protein n=1 Tax=Salipiger thiooxidans TaxID=282683 RepID=UPI0010424B0C|nr:hypothetical protein [Salipiger thiooxidans]